MFANLPLSIRTFSILFFTLCSLSLNLKAYAQATQTLGSLEVDRLGAAVYTLPISAPNGVGGVKPNITALYNSQAANGLLGKGGSIDGLSVIKRCNQTLVRDGINKAITWTADDRFCIDTQRLMLIAGTQGIADSQYKTEIDNGVVYTAKGGTAGNPDYFEATAEDGATLVFGGVAAAKEQGAATMTWALSQYKDAANNSIEYTYEGAAADGLRIKRINYAFPIPNTTTNPGAYIEFIYKDRDDPISKYVAGYEFRTNKLLTQINSYSLLGLLHRSYQFDLATSSGLAGYVTRWQSVKECTSQSQCFDSTQFEWGRTQKNATTNQIETRNIKMDFLGSTFSGRNYQLSSAISYCCTVQMTDFNGNGIADLAWIESNGAGIYNYLAINDVVSSPTETHRMTTTVAEAKYDYTSEMLPLEFADINADGIQEIITPLQGNGGYSDTNHPWGINFMHWYWGRDYRQLGVYSLAEPIDLDGDGYEEILGYNQRSIDFTLHKTQRKINEPVTSYLYRYLDYYSATLRLSDIPTANGIFVEYGKDMATAGDLNNDGKKDLLILVKLGYPSADEQIYKINWYEQKGGALEFKGTIYQESRKPLGTQPYNGGYKLSDFVALTSIKAVDINGDGLDDVVFQKNGVWMYAINKGDGFLPFVTISNKPVSKPAISSTFIDVNNDGYADYIYGESTYSYGANPYWDYTNPSIYVRYWNSKIAAFENPVLIRTTPDFPVLFADMNGDGFVDVVENKRVESDRNKDTINVYGFTNNLGNATVGFQGVLDQDTIVSIKTGVTTNASIEYQTLIRPKSIDIFTCVGNFPCFDFSTNSHYKPLKYNISRIVNSPADVQASAPSVLSNYYTKTNEPFLGINNPHAGSAKVAQYVAPLPIVTRVKNNLVTANDKKYYYEIMRTQAGGRGLLGFEKTSVEDVATGVRTETFWRQDWPFTGFPTNKIVWNRFNKAMSEVENNLLVSKVDQSNAFKVNVSNVIEKQYETKINDEVQGGLIGFNSGSSSSHSSSSISAEYENEPAILELLAPGERSIKYVTAGVNVGLKAVVLSKDGAVWKGRDGNVPLVKFYADDYTYLGEAKADGTAFNWIPLASKTYSIKAKVFLADGVTLQSRTAGLVVSDADGYPVVDFLDTIRNGVKYSSGELVHLIVSATDKNGSVANVKFYANGQEVGVASATGGGHYRFDWTPSTAGVYKIKAIVTDNASNKAESKTLEIFYATSSFSSSSAASSSSITSLTLPLTYPLTHAVLGDNIQLGSSLRNSSGQQQYESDGSVPVVRFYANGFYVGESRADGYWFQWKPTVAGIFDVVAVSMFNNEQVVSQTATLIVKGSATANVELTAPKHYGSKYDVGNYVGISANVSDSTVNISKVIFYANDQELSVDKTLPYSYAWMPASSGIYTVKAVAVDVNGNAFVSAQKLINYGVLNGVGESSSSAYSIPSSSQSSSQSSVRDPIRFELTSPLERTTDQYGLGAEVVLGAPVIGADGSIWTDAAGNAAQVDYYANEQLLTGLRKDPRGYYSFWKPIATGTYNIKAVARINENKTITTGYGAVQVISANAPTVSLVHPAADRFLKLGDSLNLVANASDTDGNLLSVNFYANEERLSLPVQGKNPFNLLWTPYITGEYFIRAEAMDKTYVKSTTGTIRVSVVNPGLKPVVTLLTPDNGSQIAFGSTLTLFANAIDFDGSISKIEFYANDKLIGTSTTAPYKLNYIPTSADTYLFKAVAYDNLGNSTTSAIRQTQYGLSAPSFNIIDPDDDCFYGFRYHRYAYESDSLVYELYERKVGTEWLNSPVARRSLAMGNLPPFNVYFNDHEPGDFEYRARVCPGNNLAACSPYSGVFPVFLYQNCKSISLPNVQLIEPPSKLKLGDSAVLKADAKIANNKPLIVRFYYGDKLLGVDNTAPYSLSWTPTETGRDNLYAQAEGGFEATGISDLHIVDVLTPEDYANGAASSTSRSASSSSNVSVASTSSNSFNSSSQSSLVPQFALFTPEPGKLGKTYLGDEAMLFAAVYDQDLRPWKNQDGSLPRIEYYVNNQLITDLRNDAASGIKYWKPTALGNYGIKATAYLDGQTLTTSVGVISVVKPLPPSISLEVSQGTKRYAGSSVNVVTTVVDPDMQTREVKFFANGEQIALPDFDAPYEAGWIPTLPGTYQLQAELLDKLGNVIRSPVATLTVDPAILPDFDGVRGVSDYGDAQLQGLKWTPINHSDVLVSKTPNTGKVSYNKLTKFNVKRPLKIINRADAYTNAFWAAKLIVIDAQEIVLNSSIEIIGEPADILLLNSSASKSIQCLACGFKNVGRVTLAVATPSVQLGNAITTIGSLTTQVGGEVSVENLQASGAVSIELLAEKVNSNGIINTQQYTTDTTGKTIGDVIIPGLSKVVGSGGVSVLHGRLDVAYESMNVQAIHTGAPTLELNASIASGAINVISAAPIMISGNLNTASELRAVTQYQGKLHAQAETISIKTFAADAVSKNSITLNAALISDGKVELTSQGDIQLVSQQASIFGHALALNAVDNFKNYGDLIAKRKRWLSRLSNSEPSIQVGAKFIENRGSVDLYEQIEQADNQWGARQISGNLSLASESDVLNRFGGFLRAKTIKVIAQNGLIRNGSLYAFDDPLKENEPIAATSHDTQAISTLSALPVSDTKPYLNPKATIQGMVVQLEAGKSVENINPYTEPVRPGSAEEVDTRVPRTAQAHVDDVRIEAVNKLIIDAPQYVLNSSANLGVSEFSLTPALIIRSPLVRNERYYSYTVLDAVDETKQVVEQNPGSTSTTISSIKGVKARYGFYSPPGTIYSFAPVQMQFGVDASNTNAGLLNNAGFIDIYSTMSLYGVGRATSLGVKLDKLAYETISNTRTVLEECISRSYWNGYTEIPYKVCEQGSYNKTKTPEGKYIEPILDNTLFAVAGRLDAKGIHFSASNHEVLKDIREQTINDYIAAQKARSYLPFDPTLCREEKSVQLSADGLFIITSVSYSPKVSADVCPQRGHGETKAVSELVAVKVSILPHQLNSLISRFDSWKSRAAQ